MDAIAAMRETVALAREREMNITQVKHIPEIGIVHLEDMLKRAEEGVATGDFNYGKQCRWLGWMQACVVASGAANLDDMKNINMKNSDNA